MLNDHLSVVRICDLLDDQKPQPVSLFRGVLIANHVMRRRVQLLNLFVCCADSIVLYTDHTVFRIF